METKPKLGKPKQKREATQPIHKRLVQEVHEYETLVETSHPDEMSKLIEHKTYMIRVKVDKINGRINIENSKGKDEFIFKDYMNGETRQRWIAVARLIEQAVRDHVYEEIMPF